MRRGADLPSSLTLDVVAALAMTLLPLVLYLPAARGTLVLSPDDGIGFNIPLRVAAARVVTGGSLPLWNPYIFGGMPLLGSAQAGVLFPLNWLYFWLAPPTATNAMVLAAYGLAGLGAFLYARRSGASVIGALATGLIYQSCGFCVAHVGHTNIVHSAALLPWVLWSVDGYGGGGARWRGVMLAILVALQVFAGHPQTLTYSVLVAGAYALVMWRVERRPAYLGCLVFITAGVCLAAVQLLPTYELVGHSVRASAATPKYVSEYAMPAGWLRTFLAPYLYGGGDGVVFGAPYVGPDFYGEYIGYASVGAIMLAALAVLLEPDARAKFWAAVAAAALVLAIGPSMAPATYADLLGHIPVLNLFRVPARHVMEVDFALAALAGRGLTALARSDHRVRIRRVAAAAGIGVVVLVVWVVTNGRPTDFQLASVGPVSVWHAPELFLPITVAAVSATALWWAVHSGRPAALILVVAVIGVDLSLWAQSAGWRRSSPGLDERIWRETIPLGRIRQHADSVGHAPPYRVITVARKIDPTRPPPRTANWETVRSALALQPNIVMLQGAQNAAGYDAFGLARYSRLAGDMTVWGDVGDPYATLGDQSRALDVLNVRYLLAPRPTPDAAAPTAAPPTGARWRRIGADAGIVNTYENTRALPRAWLTTEALVIADEEALLAVIRTGRRPDGAEWNPRHTAMVEHPAPIILTGNHVIETRADCTTYEPNRIVVQTASPAPTILVLSENDYPGWRGSVDGLAVDTLRVDYNLRGVPLPAGEHVVELVYRPTSVLVGSLISLLTMAVLLVSLIPRRMTSDADDRGRCVVSTP